jgi:hypothetical protein
LEKESRERTIFRQYRNSFLFCCEPIHRAVLKQQTNQTGLSSLAQYGQGLMANILRHAALIFRKKSGKASADICQTDLIFTPGNPFSGKWRTIVQLYKK